MTAFVFYGRHKVLLLLATLLLLITSGCTVNQPAPVAYSPTPEESRLVDLMAQRLEISRSVAWNKYLNNAPVRNAKRESELLKNLVEKSQNYGLEPVQTQHFFIAQIKASRVLQTNLMYVWKRGATLPTIPYMSLQKEIRPMLDDVSGKMLAVLAKLQSRKIPPPQANAFSRYARMVLIKDGYSADVAGCAAAPLRTIGPFTP